MRKLGLSVLLLLILSDIAASNTKSLSLVNSLSKETHEDFIKELKSSDKLENNQDDILNSKIQAIIDRTRVNYQLPALSVSIKLPEENSTRNLGIISAVIILYQRRKKSHPIPCFKLEVSQKHLLQQSY